MVLKIVFNESSAELHGYTNSTRANTKCTRDIIMKYNYEKSGETKYLNIGSEAEVTALDGRLFHCVKYSPFQMTLFGWHFLIGTNLLWTLGLGLATLLLLAVKRFGDDPLAAAPETVLLWDAMASVRVTGYKKESMVAIWTPVSLFTKHHQK